MACEGWPLGGDTSIKYVDSTFRWGVEYHEEAAITGDGDRGSHGRWGNV